MRYLLTIVVVAVLTSCTTPPEPLWTYKSTQPIKAVATLGDGKQLAVVIRGSVIILNAESGKDIVDIPSDDANIHAIACTSNICWIGGGEHENGYLAIVDVQRRETKRIALPENIAAINAVAISTNGSLATGHADETVILWEPKEMRPQRRMVIQGGLEIYTLHFVTTTLAIGNDKGDLILWDGQSDAPTQRVNITGGAIFSITANDDYLFAGGWQYLDVLNLRLPSEMQHVRFDHMAILSCDSAAGEQVVWCGSSDGLLSRIDTNGLRMSTVKLHDDEIRFLKLLDRAVITASKDNTVSAWNRGSLTFTTNK